ncbi:lipopolysaccharide core heptose(I) kinase RfaP [Methylobacillus flagellatus]|uniref:lipopolysaccharide core heptose(I) kinase RfaP n=1 Tax=Methylobacillus flagellatus TaxID=405 RepID=UPI0010F5CC92|nr:lipopolysaccharide core heptose(I) kinase RfaP [Methylobacillus flagellatus]
MHDRQTQKPRQGTGCANEQIPLPVARHFGGEQAFSEIMVLNGEVFRDMPGRRTLRFHLDGRPYFVKLHFGVGWREIFKNLLTLRLPIVSAMPEWRAIHRFNQIGIPTTPPVAFASRGCNPAQRQSFVMTEDLGDIVSLETLCADWKTQPPEPAFKRSLILEVARLTQLLHANGMNHRDLYICHFCLDLPRLAQGDLHLYLIDLHRVGMRRRISYTDRLKDIAALYFSALDIGLTQRDFLRFVRAYRGHLRDWPKQDRHFWPEVQKRAVKLFQKFHGRPPALPF